jgi:uncharacterized protein YxeA
MKHEIIIIIGILTIICILLIVAIVRRPKCNKPSSSSVVKDYASGSCEGNASTDYNDTLSAEMCLDECNNNAGDAGCCDYIAEKKGKKYVKLLIDPPMAQHCRNPN